MPSTATITAFYSFSPLTVIKSAYVNANFNLWRGHVIPIDPTAASSPDITYDLGADGHAWRGVYHQYGYHYANSTVTTNPPAGYVSLYAKSDNKVYKRTSAGTESEIASSPLTTRGDLLTHNNTDLVRLAAGSNGQVLVADAGTTTGLKWANPSAVTNESIVSTSGGMTVSNTHDWAVFTGSSASTWGFYAASSGTKKIGVKNRGSADLTLTCTAANDLFDTTVTMVIPPGASYFFVPETTYFNVF